MKALACSLKHFHFGGDAHGYTDYSALETADACPLPPREGCPRSPHLKAGTRKGSGFFSIPLLTNTRYFSFRSLNQTIAMN